MRVARGPPGIPHPSIPGHKTLCGVNAGTGAFLSSADMYLVVFLESPQWSQSLSRVETGMSGNFLSCSKGVKDPLEVPEVRCD